MEVDTLMWWAAMPKATGSCPTAHDFIEMQGGLAIVVDGEVIGGIGASFDTPEHDAQIAQAGLAALTD